MDWHAKKVDDVLSELDTGKKGLDESEAKLRLRKFGLNEIKERKRLTKTKLLFSQFKSFLIIILIIAGIISWLIGHMIDAIVILIVVFLNVIISFIQEYKAEEIIEKLKKSLRYNVLVMRNGKQKEINPKFLVPGDIVILNEGDKILVDCRLISQEGFQVNESVLTGESLPISKEADTIKGATILAERKNMLYAGTSVVSGHALAVVIRTGSNTEFGKLAKLVQETKDEKMPLEKKINSFSKIISLVILFLITIIFLFGLYIGIDKFEMFLISVSLAVGAIPEGLPAVIAIILAVAIKQMYKVNTLVRKMPAVETLGRTTIICTDKTGTLTEEKLTVEKLYSGKNYLLQDKLDINLRKLLLTGILCNNARDENENILGDPTEKALVEVAKKFGISKKEETEKNLRFKEFPFSSERKMMTIIRESGKIKTAYVKGAPSFILERCNKEFVNGRLRLIDKERRNELKKIYSGMEQEGLRVLGFAIRQLPSRKLTQTEIENHLILTGFQGMIDLPRKEIKQSLKEAISAGIEIKIITGDSLLTTKTIAKKIGLDGGSISGEELEKLNNHQLKRVIFEKTIFARITPEQKLKIIEVLKSNNKEVVAVTGDGVNDILALKRADVGISMGIRGSDIARDSSDIVLLDDNFASIVKAIKQGRTVFDNLKKSIKFLLAANVAEVFVILFALIIQWPLPLLPLAMLWMNLITDSLPAMALAFEPPEQGIMKRKPSKDGLLSHIWGWMIIAGILNFLIIIIIFYYALNSYSLEIARTMAVTSGIFFELFFVFSCKSERSLFKTGIKNNKWLIYAFFISIFLHFALIYSSLGSLFDLVPLNALQFLIVIGSGLVGLIVFEGWKVWKGR